MAQQTLERIADELSLPNSDDRLHDRRIAEELNKRDPIARFRDQFLFPRKKDIQEDENGSEEPAVYLCGNSLVLQPKNARVYVLEEMEKWHRVGVEGHFSGARPWLTIDEFVHEKMARVVGALPSEVAVMNSLTTNIHLLLVSFYRPTPQRYKIIIEKGAFPSDLYVVNSQAEYHGFKASDAVIQMKPREGEFYLRTEDVIAKIKEVGDSLALVMFGGVQYYSGQFFNIPEITKATQEVGAVSGWDLAHSVGNLPLKLHDWGVDFACWCSYKYLNSGPGSIGGAFVHERHGNNKDLPRFAGWWGHDLSTRFQMDEPTFNAIPGAFGWRLSNPAVLPTVCLQASLDLFDEAGMENLREKSLLLTGYLEFLLQSEVAAKKVQIITPTDPNQRGCQLSLRFENDQAKVISEKLHHHGVVCDLRKPDVIRVSPAPLYNNFTDVWEFVNVFKSILSE